MLDQQKDNDAEPAHVPRNKDGSIRKTFVRSVARGIAAADAGALRKLVSDLHEADLGDLLEALEPEQRPRLVELLGIDFDFTALTEVDDAVREEILDELPSKTVAQGVRDLESDDAVAILEDLPKDEQSEILAQLPPPERVALAAQPAIPGRFRRPAHADRIHRRAGRLDRRAGHRLHARDRRSARPLLRTLRRRRPTAVSWARCRSTGCCAASARCRSPS